ncbi:MAG: hypothetical protein OEV42_05990 [Deltaproteobacteria bacterium]|nr:hypothetical protein [Deltaproteobacteria bacterium]
MLRLESNRWSELQHAYGEASDIPDMLRKLASNPPYKDYESEPYFSLWSALCHQDDVYTASYAATPHIIKILAADPAKAHWHFFLLPTCIEISRYQGRGPEIPTDLKNPYFESLSRLPLLVAEAAKQDWDGSYSRAVAAAVIVAKGHHDLAEAILELSEDVVPEFMEWIRNR